MLIGFLKTSDRHFDAVFRRPKNVAVGFDVAERYDVHWDFAMVAQALDHLVVAYQFAGRNQLIFESFKILPRGDLYRQIDIFCGSGGFDAVSVFEDDVSGRRADDKKR